MQRKYNFDKQGEPFGLAQWSPTINMARDPRWGRAEESYGEDPYLTGQIAEAFINGLQGAHEPGGDTYLKTMATPKHFLGNNSESNRHNGSANIDERDLREYYTYAFKNAIENGKAESIMTSYNAVNGVPMSVNTPILEDLLRRTWGFDGYVTTDCDTLSDVIGSHDWRPTDADWDTGIPWEEGNAWGGKEAAALALKAGVDANCGTTIASNVKAAIDAGLMTEDDVDKTLVRLFTARMKTGEFDPDKGPFGQIDHVIHSEENQALAEKSSDNAVVLLKNEGILPLGTAGQINRLVLVGPRADELELGDYSTYEPQHTSTALQGIQAAYERYCAAQGIEGEFSYIPGASASSSGNYLMNVGTLTMHSADGTQVRELQWSDHSELSGCQVESGGNLGYMSKGETWVRFDQVDFSEVKTIQVRMAGDTNAVRTTMEIRVGSPTGQILGTMDQGAGDTGGWQNYQTYEFQFTGAGGGYDGPQSDVYFVFRETTTAGSGFTEAEQDKIRAADAVIFFAGTKQGENGYFENTDGYNLNLPGGQTEMIQSVASLNADTVVYLQAVSQINVEPFRDEVKGLFWSTYNGQAQGNAAGRLLFGEANPSAKLPFSWYSDINDLADVQDYQLRADGKNPGRTYQYFTGPVTYPFGYGLSYSQFVYSNLTLSSDRVTPDDSITVEFDVTNNSAVDGQEVAQLYVVSPDAEEKDRPAKRLKGFDKKTIPAGETVHYTIELPVEDLWYWDAEQDIQTYDQGVYTVQVGGNSTACAGMSETFTLSGQLSRKLHAATAMPSGHILDTANPDKHITTDLSASYNDQTFVDLDGAAVRYTSSKPEVASVDAAGVVTAVAGGIATITAEVTVNGETISDSYPVVVLENIAATGITVDGVPVADFAPDVTEYHITVSTFDPMPVVDATAGEGVEVAVEQATVERPIATVTLTKGEVTMVYTISFQMELQSFDFTTATEDTLRSTWDVLRENPEMWLLDENGLTITAEEGDLYNDINTARNIFLQNAPGDWTVQVQIELDQQPSQSYQQVAMLAYEDDSNYLKIGYQGTDGKPASVQLNRELDGSFQDIAAYSQNFSGTSIWFRLQKAGDTYTGWYSEDGMSYLELGSLEMPLEQVKIAVTANTGTQDAAPIHATFKRFQVLSSSNLFVFKGRDDLPQGWTVCYPTADGVTYSDAGAVIHTTNLDGMTKIENQLQYDTAVRGNWSVETHFQINRQLQASYEQFGLCMFQDASNYAYANMEYSSSGNKLYLRLTQDGNTTGPSIALGREVQDLYLRMQHTDGRFVLFYSLDGSIWEQAAELEATDASWLAEGCFVRLYATSQQAGNESFDAAVEYCKLEELAEIGADGAVTGVRLDKTSAAVKEGGTIQLTAQVLPEHAVNRKVSWKPSDENVAAVDQTGQVRAVAEGTATITVVTDEGGYHDSVVVRVLRADATQAVYAGGDDAMTWPMAAVETWDEGTVFHLVAPSTDLRREGCRFAGWSDGRQTYQPGDAYTMPAGGVEFEPVWEERNDNAPEPWGATPNALQMRYYEEGVSGFIHYGPNTYRDIEWGDDGLTTPDMVQVPDDVDTDQWVQTFKDAGVSRVLITAKHHDGFRMWDTGEFSVKQAGVPDVLAAFSASCNKLDMDMGLYLSPWDVYEEKGKKLTTGEDGVYGNGSGTKGADPLDDDYNKLYRQQLMEIFSNDLYGHHGNFTEVWYDGAKAGGKNQYYDFREINRIMKEMNGKGTDEECIGQNCGSYQQVSWPGNENGYIDENLWSKVTLPQDHIWDDHTDQSIYQYANAEGTHWTVWEGDYSIRPGWFYHPSQDGSVKTPEEIFQRYLDTVGHGGVMLLNIPPMPNGRMHETDVENAKGFKALLDETFREGTNLVLRENVQITADKTRSPGDFAAENIIDGQYDTYWTMDDEEREGSFVIDLGAQCTFDLVELDEYIPLGQRIDQFKVEINRNGDWEEFGSGTLVGYRRFVTGPVVRTDKIRITVSSSYAVPVINGVGVHKLPKSMEETLPIPNGLQCINDKDMTQGTPSTPESERSDAWYLARSNVEATRNLINDDVTLLSQNGYKEITFTGSKFYIRGMQEPVQWAKCDMVVTIDDGDPILVNVTNQQSEDPRHPFPGASQGYIVYTSPDLSHGTHTVRIEPALKDSQDNYINLDAFLYCDNPTGMFEFADVGVVNVEAGDRVTVEVRRLGDCSEAASVNVAAYPGTAVHGVDFEQKTEQLDFAAGERQKTVTFETLPNASAKEDRSFTLELEPLEASTPDSFNMSLTVCITGQGSGAPVNVTGVNLDLKNEELTVGKTLTLHVTVEPEDATDKTVTWSTSDDQVATVENGVVTAVAEGTADITVTTTDGGFTDTCKVTVQKSHTHELTHTPAKNPTCTEAGSTEYWYCAGCGKYFSDEAGTTEITLDATVLPALGHDFGTEWTFDESGHWHACSRCGEKDEGKAHVPGPEATEDDPQVCTECGYILEPATGHIIHTPGTQWYHDETQHWHLCTGCDLRMDVEDHSGGTATCTQQAECEVCGTPYGELAEHTYEWAHDDTQHWKICKDCGAVDGSTYEAHTWVEDEERSGDKTVWYVCPCGAEQKASRVIATPTLILRAEQADGGAISPESKIVARGGEVTFTITPSSGYHIADVLVDGRSVGAVSEYTFKNVSTHHTITAVFSDGSTPVETVETVKGFTDVTADDWFADAVAYAVDAGLMNGTASTTFSPKGDTTRGMIVTVLYRLAGSPDVESDNAVWWSDARVWAMAEGISDGTNMDGKITREQLAAMLYRYAGSPKADGDLSAFTDAAKVSDWAADALVWATTEGIVTGKTGGILDPRAGATRAETAAMLQRLGSAF